MRRITIAYAAVSMWVFGWLTGTFGFLHALLAAAIFTSPVFFSWRMITSNRPVKRREYGYLTVVTMLALSCTTFLVVGWYATGMDRLAMFGREYRAFQRRVSTMPEYKNVEVSHTLRKGGRVCLHGSVVAKTSHDRLIQMIDRMIRNDECGYYDGVDYPGKDPAE